MKEKQVSFKLKNKEIDRIKIIESEIKAEIIEQKNKCRNNN